MTIDVYFGSVLFVLVLLTAFFFSHRRWNAGFTACLVWAVVYPSTQGWLILVGGEAAGWQIGLGIPSLVSATLLCWSTRSPIPATGCLVGWVLTA